MVVPGGREPKIFFKIMLPPTLQDKRLRIPLKFVEEFRDDISSPATLVLPGEKRWTVKVLSEGGELWFSDGLEKFFEFYSVSFGFFLLFKYREKSEFRVRIFNLSACEISYPSIDASIKLSPPSAKADLSESRSEQVLNADRVIHVKKEVESTSNIDNHDNDDGDLNSYYDDEEFNFNYVSGSDDDVVVIERRRRVKVVVLSSDDEDQSIAMKKKARLNVGDGKSRNSSSDKPKNPSFRAKMKSYNIESDPMSLNIPAHIGRKFPRGMSGLVKLEVSDGRSWIVQGNFLGGRLRSLGNRWSEFVRQMKLKVGDLCAFELITSDKEFTMKVSIVRNKPITRGIF